MTPMMQYLQKYRQISKYILFLVVIIVLKYPQVAYAETTYLSAQNCPKSVYQDAVYYHEQICSEGENTLRFEQGYLFWSVKDISVQEEIQTDHKSFEDCWQVTIFVDDLRITFPIENEVYDVLDQKITKQMGLGQKSSYCLYGVASDKLQELATQKDASMAERMFMRPYLYISISQGNLQYTKKIANEMVTLQYRNPDKTEELIWEEKVRQWQLAKIYKLEWTKEGYTYMNQWMCEESGMYFTCEQKYHPSFLWTGMAEMMDRIVFTALDEQCWQRNTYRITYYAKLKLEDEVYTQVGTQNCVYGQTYSIFTSKDLTNLPCENVTLKGWSRQPDSEKEGFVFYSSGEYFNQKICDESSSSNTGNVCLYAVWEVCVYRIYAETDAQSEDETTLFYEIYGIGFTKNVAFAQMTISCDPFYWSKNSLLIQAQDLRLKPCEKQGYWWRGYVVGNQSKTCFDGTGKATFCTMDYFTEDTQLNHLWEAAQTLVLHYENMNGEIFQTQQVYAYEEITIAPILEGEDADGWVYEQVWTIAGTNYQLQAQEQVLAENIISLLEQKENHEQISVSLTRCGHRVRYYVDYYVKDNAYGDYQLAASQQCLYGTTYRFYNRQQCGVFSIPEGKVFDGWSLERTEETEELQGERPKDVIYKSREEFTNLTNEDEAHICLYMCFATAQYELILDGNCPYMSKYPVIMGTRNLVYTEEEMDNMKSVIPPQLMGYEFLGFYSSQPDEKQLFDSSGKFCGTISQLRNEKTLYAKWEKQKYTILFDANGGVFGDETSEYRYADLAYGDYLPMAQMPFRLGYTFDGYYVQEGGPLWYDAMLSPENKRFYEKTDIKLVAAWKDVSSPHATLRPNVYTTKQLWTNLPVWVCLDATDMGSGIVKLQLYQKELGEKEFKLIEEWEQAPANHMQKMVQVKSTGITSLYCVAWDAEGNSSLTYFSEPVGITTFYIDRQPPVVTEPILTDLYFHVEASDEQRI